MNWLIKFIQINYLFCIETISMNYNLILISRGVFKTEMLATTGAYIRLKVRLGEGNITLKNYKL